jgi:ABC-type dipeptide/oligopeptide/nickel transport system ATPase component
MATGMPQYQAKVCRNYTIPILDEPSSGLDVASEEHVFEALSRLTQDKTAIVMGPRLTTVRRADVIFVPRDVGSVEPDAREELLARRPLRSTSRDPIRRRSDGGSPVQRLKRFDAIPSHSPAIIKFYAACLPATEGVILNFAPAAYELLRVSCLTFPNPGSL